MPAAAPSLVSGDPVTAVAGLLQSALLHSRKGELARAAECYRRVLGVTPNSRVALLGLSFLARQSAQPEAALRMAEAALGCCDQTSPERSLIQTQLARCLLAMHRVEEAEAILREVLDADSSRAGREERRWERSNGAPGEGPQEGGTLSHPAAKLARIEAEVGLGELMAGSGRFEQSILLFHKAIALQSTNASAHYGLGSALSQVDDFSGALESFRVAAKLAPASHLSHFALGFSYARLGQVSLAIAAYRQALRIRPNFASAWLNLGVALVADGRDQLAGPCYQQAIAVLPLSASGYTAAVQTHISAHLNLGHLERSRRNFLKAKREYEEAHKLALENEVRTAARRSEIYVAFVYLNLEENALRAAQAALDAAVEADHAYLRLAGTGVPPARSLPRSNCEIWNAEGILLLGQHAANCREPSEEQPGTGLEGFSRKVENAIEAFRKAENLGHRTAASNRGNALLRLGRCREALEAHSSAVTLEPNHPGARYNLSLTQLRLGDFAAGWKNYESRWSFREVHPRPRRFFQPRWQGEALCSNRTSPAPTLLVYAEQGLGDTLQFVRYLTLIAERILGAKRSAQVAAAAEIVFEVQTPLARLLLPFLRSFEVLFPAIQTKLICQGSALPHFTHHCPLLSMPAIFETRLDSIPQPSVDSGLGYLRADAELIGKRRLEIERDLSACQSRCGSKPDFARLKVGIAWAGNPKYRTDHERSVHLRVLLPLLAMREVAWFSLQKGDAAWQILEIAMENRPYDSSSADTDLADTAALLANLDLIVTTDTVIAHLAGAMGKPLWLLLPWQSDWRWMQEILTTPWYPTARLFRQRKPGDWRELVERVRTELRSILETLACDKTDSPVVLESKHVQKP